MSSSARPVRLKHRVEYVLVAAASLLARALPAGAARGLGRALGALAFALGLRRDVARANLERAFPEKSPTARDAIAREAYAQAGMTALEILRYPSLTAADVDRIAPSVLGLEHVTDARAAGRGVVLLSGHFGAFEMMGAVVARAGFPLHFLVRGQTNPLVDELLQGHRTRLGVSVVPHGVGVRAALVALKANECLAVLADQDAGRRGVFVDFFGTPASTPPGPAEFCVRTGAPLVMGYLARRPDGAYFGTFFPAFHPPESGDPEADVRTLTAQHARMLEEWIRAYPEQWLWTHRRWKTRPLAALLLAFGLAALAAPFAPARAQAPTAPKAGAAADSGGALALVPRAPESAFDGAGSSVFPLSPARVRRIFEGVRIRRIDGGWQVDAEEIFQAGVAPASAVMGLPDYRASLPESDSTGGEPRGTVRGLTVTVDGLPMAVTELPGSEAPAQDLGGIERLFRWEVPFSAEEIRTVRLEYRIGDSRTDRGEPLLFFYLNPGSLWEGEAAKVTVSVDLGAVDPEDLIPGWLRPRGGRIYGSQVIWRRRAGDEVADIALAYRLFGDPLAAFPDRARGPVALAPEAREEWFERLSVRETRFWITYLRARRGGPIDPAGPGAALAKEAWYRPVRGYRDERLGKDEKVLLGRLNERIAEWDRAQIPGGVLVAP